MPHDFGILAQPCQDIYHGVPPEPLYVFALTGSRDERPCVIQPCQCETERNSSLAHFLCHFLVGLLNGWLGGGTEIGEKREVDVVNRLN